MNERFVTIDGRDHALGDEFMVVATQNPLSSRAMSRSEARSTVLVKIITDHPTRDQGAPWCTATATRGSPGGSPISPSSLWSMPPAPGGSPWCSRSLSDAVIDYVVDVVRATRQHAWLETGFLAARRHHAGQRRARLRHHAGPRLRHP
jgi:MoxR-like ATPase